MRVTIISGSSRANNNTIRLAKAFEHEFNIQGQDTLLVGFEDYDLPFPGQGKIDMDHLTPFQNKLVKGMEDANIIVLLTPEYNWFPSAEIVNMMHQLGSSKFSYLFDNKVFAVGGVSTGAGGRMPAVQLGYVIDKIISHFRKDSITSSRKFESHFTANMIDEEGNIVKEGAFEKSVKEYIGYTISLAEKWF